MELLLKINTAAAMSVNELEELDSQSRRQKLTAEELVVDFIRDGLRRIRDDKREVESQPPTNPAR